MSGTALADDAAILKCRALSDATSRANCYDAIPAGVAATAKLAAPSAKVRRVQ